MSETGRGASGRPHEAAGRPRQTPGDARRHDGGPAEPGLYGCLYLPPLPGQVALAEPEAAGDGPPSRGSVPAAAPASGGRRVERGVTTRAGSRVLLAIAAEFSPRYESHRPDLVSLDLRGLSRLFGSPRAIGEEVRREAASRGVRVHVAVAASRTAALVLALARPGLTVVSAAEQAEALASIPLVVLEQLHEEPLAGAGSATHVRLRAEEARAAHAALKRWGLRTLGELAALPAADLSARLGRGGRVWQAVARGEELRPLVPVQPDERFEGTLELEWPIEGHEPLSFVLTRLLEPLSTRLERRDRGAAVLHVTLRLVTRELHACRLELPTPLRDVRTLRTLALLDVDAHPPAAAIDCVTVTIEPTPGRVVQHALFARPHPTPEQLSTLLARLGAVMGQDRVGAPAVVDSYRPGAFALTPFATEHAELPERAGAAGQAGGAAPVPGAPAWLALRRCRQPVPARVAVDARERPIRVSTDRRGFAGGRVLACAGPWRTSGAWWEDEPLDPPVGGEGGAPQDLAGRSRRVQSGGWNRDEWDVSLDDGAVYRIFRDRGADTWFIDAVLD